jgi:hypothetical protein
MKTCTSCNKILNESEFYVDKRSRDGLTRACKSCLQKQVNQYQLEHPKEKHPRIKKVRHCVICGVMVTTQSKYCPICKENKKYKTECRYCGKKLLGGKKICDECKERIKTKDLPAYHRDATRKWKEENPVRAWAGHSISAKKHNSKFTLTLTIEELMAKAPTHCPLCGCELIYKSKGIGKSSPINCSPSLDRINNELVVRNDNTWVICHKCNTTKSNRTLQEFINYCTKVASFKMADKSK